MRSLPRIEARRCVVPVLAAACGALGQLGCVDLFHSTDDVVTGCQIDAQAVGCALEAAADAGDAGAVD